MKRHLAVLFILILVVSACGGAKNTPKTAPPPPPLDENLLGLVPFETDLVVWANFEKLRKASIWSLVDNTFRSAAPDLTVKEVLDLLFSSKESVLGFMDSEQFGNQLLVITRSTPEAQSAALTGLRAKPGALSLKAEGFDALRTKEMFVLSLTPQTLLFGNEAVVRMAAKAALKKGRSIADNPEFDAFKTDGDFEARMYYRRGLNTNTVARFKTVVPRMNPNAVATVDGTLNADQGARVKLELTMESQMDAAVFAEEIGRTLNELKSNMIVLFLGLDWLRNKILVTAEKNLVKVDINLDARDVESLTQLADRLKKIQELLGGMENKM